MKIGILSYRSHPYSGGQGIYVRHLSKALQRLGHEVTVLSGPPYPQLDSEIELEKIPSLDLFGVEDRIKEFKFSLLFSPLDLYEWISVITGGFPEPYTFGRRVLNYLKASEKDFDIILSPSFGKNQLLITNLTGHPVVSLPNGLDEKGRPTSISIICNYGDEDKILYFAEIIQNRINFNKKKPPLFN